MLKIFYNPKPVKLGSKLTLKNEAENALNLDNSIKVDTSITVHI